MGIARMSMLKGAAVRHFIEAGRYLIVGGLNALLTCGVYYCGLYLLRQHYLLALIEAFLVGTVFTYTLNYVWVFRLEDRFEFNHRFLRHLLPNVVTFSANLAALYALVEYAHWDPFTCQIVLMCVVVTINFLSAKFWAFRKVTAPAGGQG